MRHVACLLALLFVCGCSRQDIIDKFSSPADQALAKAYFTHLSAREFDAVERDIDPSIKGPSAHEALEKLADLMPPGEPTSVKVVGAHFFKNHGASTLDTVFEYNFGEKWFLADAVILNKDGAKTIVGLHLNQEAASLDEQNRFTLSGKSAGQYALLTAAISAAVVTLVALIICVRTKFPRRKWLWILFILFGFGMLSVDWTHGGFRFIPISVQLFSASAGAQLYSPWIVSVSAPVGAIIFLIYWLVRLRHERPIGREDPVTS